MSDGDVRQRQRHEGEQGEHLVLDLDLVTASLVNVTPALALTVRVWLEAVALFDRLQWGEGTAVTRGLQKQRTHLVSLRVRAVVVT